MTIRIGLLAAARIATRAVVEPAGAVDGVEVVAVAARTLAKAQASAEQWGLTSAYGSYAELLADDSIDAVYIGTPNGLHRPWAVAALEAGKHVLVEKPLGANMADAQLIAAADQAHPELVCMEAFHWPYHPAAIEVRRIIEAGQIGPVQRVESRFNLPRGLIPSTDIRWDFALAGGAMMDLGCYSIQWARHVVAGAVQVRSATADTADVADVDGKLVAELDWHDGVTGVVEASMIEPSRGPESIQAELVVHGAAGSLRYDLPIRPHHGGLITVTVDGETETIDPTALPGGDQPTYYHQMVAFRDAITDGTAFVSTTADGVTNMEILDACYEAAGLTVRPPSPVERL